jgi:hypothetical protein
MATLIGKAESGQLGMPGARPGSESPRALRQNPPQKLHVLVVAATGSTATGIPA